MSYTLLAIKHKHCFAYISNPASNPLYLQCMKCDRNYSLDEKTELTVEEITNISIRNREQLQASRTLADFGSIYPELFLSRTR